MGEIGRKVRSDKKRDIKPTVKIELKDSIYRLSYITKTPVKDICELLILHALYENNDILKNLSTYLIRDIQINNTIFLGNLSNKRLPKTDSGETERVSFRVKNEVYNLLQGLAYSLDCSVSRISGWLLHESITDAVFIEKHIERFMASLDKSRRKELRELLRYIQRETGNNSYSLADLISYLVEEPIKWLFPD